MTQRFVLHRSPNMNHSSFPSHNHARFQMLTLFSFEALALMERWPALDTTESIEEYVVMNKSRGAS